MSRSAGPVEYFGCVFHGINITHIDALSHVFWDRQSYNGKPAELVNCMFGATNLAVTSLADGIFTRGVLIDVPVVRGVDWLQPGEGVFPADLEAAEKRAGTTVPLPDPSAKRQTINAKKKNARGTPPGVFYWGRVGAES